MDPNGDKEKTKLLAEKSVCVWVLYDSAMGYSALVSESRRALRV